jgi:hypothetical protein
MFLNPKLSHWLLALLRSQSVAASFSVQGIEPTSDLFHFVKILKIKSSRQYAAQPGGLLWQK